MKSFSLFILLAFMIGDCVQLKQSVWWSIGKWQVIGIEQAGYILYDGYWTVHDVPEYMLKKCI